MCQPDSLQGTAAHWCSMQAMRLIRVVQAAHLSLKGTSMLALLLPALADPVAGLCAAAPEWQQRYKSGRNTAPSCWTAALLSKLLHLPAASRGLFRAVIAAGLGGPSSATRPSGEAASGAGVQPATGDTGPNTSSCCSMPVSCIRFQSWVADGFSACPAQQEFSQQVLMTKHPAVMLHQQYTCVQHWRVHSMSGGK